jgi:hypothetical protein
MFLDFKIPLEFLQELDVIYWVSNDGWAMKSKKREKRE